MVRRIVETSKMTRESEKLMIVTVYEEGFNKETVKKENVLSKRHKVIYQCGGSYEFK